MAHLIACPECDKPLQAPEELLGKEVQCPECQHTFTAILPEAPAPTKVATKPPDLAKKKTGSDASKSTRRRRDDEDDDEDYGRERDRDRDDDEDDDLSIRRRRSARRGDD